MNRRGERWINYFLRESLLMKDFATPATCERILCSWAPAESAYHPVDRFCTPHMGMN